MPRPSWRSEEGFALLALAAIVAVTAAWWAVALWPLPESSAGWLARARAVCFGVRPDGLPDVGGWLLLVGEPVGMAAALMVVWGAELRRGVRRAAASRAGRGALAALALAVAAGVGATGVRVADARAAAAAPLEIPASGAVRVDRPAPPLRLLDQHGDTITLERFRGRPVLLTFAYGRCETVCPLVVRDVLRARGALAGADPAVLVVTVDPWRDTPSRLPHLARAWGLPGDARVLGGSVPEVEAVLDAWKVGRARDLRTGEVAHPPLVYLVDRRGRAAWAMAGGAEEIARLAARL